MVYDIRAEYVRVLKFAKGSRRPNDQMDAVVPKLYKAMRLYAAGTPLGATDAAPLIVFSRRMGGVKLDTPKMNARLQVILLAISRLLGDREGAARAEEKLARYAPALTNPATRAFAHLCDAVLTRTPSLLTEGYKLWEMESVNDRLNTSSSSIASLWSEYSHYINREPKITSVAE